MTILITSKRIETVYGNHADDCVDGYQYDIIIDNSRGLAELQEEAQIFYDCFIK